MTQLANIKDQGAKKEEVQPGLAQGVKEDSIATALQEMVLDEGESQAGNSLTTVAEKAEKLFSSFFAHPPKVLRRSPCHGLQHRRTGTPWLHQDHSARRDV